MTIKNRSFSKYFGKYWLKIVLALLLALAATATSFLSPQILSTFVDKLSVANSFQAVWNLIVAWLLTELTGHIVRYSTSLINSKTMSNIHYDIQMYFAKRIKDATVESVANFSPTSLTATLRDDPIHLVEAAFNICGEIFNILLGIGSMFYVFYASIEIFTIMAISLITILIVQFAMTKRRLLAINDARDAGIHSKTVWEAVIGSFLNVQVQNLDHGLKPQVSCAMEADNNKNLRVSNISHRDSLLTNILSTISITVFLVAGGLFVFSSALSLADFLVIYMYKGYIYNIVSSSLRILKAYSQYKSSATRLVNLDETLHHRHYGKKHLPHCSGAIEVNDLTVSRGDKVVINGLTTKIPAGEMVGIVGPSGCGKSTLVQVLAGVFPVYDGQISLDGVSIRDLTKRSFNAAMHLVPQTPPWFDFLTIRQNLTLNENNATDGELWDALEEAKISNFVREKGGLDVCIHKAKMSGGQLQRLSLAIAVLSGSKIIILDESTSALDGESQSFIIKAIKRTTKARRHTIILVAHRISTLKEADRIIVMDKGRIVDVGTYDELMERCELFQNLALNS